MGIIYDGYYIYIYSPSLLIQYHIHPLQLDHDRCVADAAT